MAISTETLAQHVERCYRTQDWDSLAEIYRPDVVLDVHPPTWRFQLQGPEALIGWWKAQVANLENFRVTWLRATPTQDGVVVEWEMRAGEGDNERLCRQVDVLHGDGTHIELHVMSCTGVWDHATIKRQQAEAPMIRW
jgi:hypothetical protein